MTTVAATGRWQPPRGSRTRLNLPTKNSSVFNPLTLPGLAAWWDSSDAATLTDAGSGHISSWADKSGNARTLTQSTDANRPVSGTRTQNGLNVLDFNPASTQWMRTATDFLASGASPVSMAVMVKCDEAGSAARRVWSSGTTSDGRYFYRRGTATGEYAWNAQDGDAFGGAFGTVTRIITGTDKNGAQLLRSNGVQIFTDTKGRGITGGSNFYVGVFPDATSNPFDGFMGEILLGNAEWTAGQLSDIETYLNAKWVVF